VSEKLPAGWAWSNLEETCASAGGGTPSKAEPAFWTNGTIPWVSPKDMKARVITSSEDRVAESALDRLTLIPTGSLLLVVRSGILSRTLPVAVTALPVTVNQDMRAFIPRGGMSSDFLAWQLIGKERDVLAATSKDGTTVASIEAPALASFPLAIAPTAEQTRIVSKLEELLSDLDAGVAELKAAQRKLQQYRQSLLKAAVEGSLTKAWRAAHPAPEETGAALLARILVERRARWEAQQLAKFDAQGKAPPKGWQGKYPEAVGPDRNDLPQLPADWTWASLDQLSRSVRNGVSSTPNKDGVGLPILRINAVRPMQVRLDEIRHLEVPAGDVLDYFVEAGDLLATRYNGSVDLLGVFGLVRDVTGPVLHPDKLIRIKPVLDRVLGPWLEIAANSGAPRRYIVGRVKTTAGQTGISGEDLKKMPIPLPPLAEQSVVAEQIALLLAAVEQQVNFVEHGLTQSTAQRQNLLRAAFAGQLVPQDPADEPAGVLLDRIRVERAAHGQTSKPRRRMSKEIA
jgi:type I restriction enzyme, S subunit